MKFLKVLFVFILCQSSFAGVNLKNGNFYISYTDIIVPGGGQDLEITRTYNSKSTDIGWFGFGWGSDYETYLITAADGSVVVHENGAGSTTRFTPRSAVNAKAAAKKIVDSMRKKSSMSEQVAKKLIKKLAKDADLRHDYAKQFGVKANLAIGSKLYSSARGVQEVHVIKDGYKRVYNNGKVESFNKSGKLTKIKHKNGYFVDFKYKGAKLHSIKDSLAKQLFFEWHETGRVKKIASTGKRFSSYKFKGRNLTESKDIADNVYNYSYDSNHNMGSVAYADKSKMQVKYGKKTQFVSEVVGRNGESTKYEYGANPKNPDFHYWTTVSKKKSSGKLSKNYYEYEIKSKPDGAHYTHRIKTVVNGVTTETIYADNSLPSKIRRGTFETTFKYNKKGLLTSKKNSRGESYELKYHPKFNKITEVKTNKGWTKFTYDKKANLAKAVNNRGKSVLLVYDRKGRIQKMVDHNKKTKKRRTLSFKYNALDKPVEIAMEKVGKINVAYDNYGEIKKVESKSGQRMALQVTQAFQSLLAIVKPAGVDLNM